ncbi:MAG: hypothetical protein AB1758_12525 [Candidatus Eremiobacterota bacterium]
MRFAIYALVLALAAQTAWFFSERSTRMATGLLADSFVQARSWAATDRAPAQVRLCAGHGRLWLRVSCGSEPPADVVLPPSVVVVAPADGAVFSPDGAVESRGVWLVVNSVTGSCFRVHPSGQVRARAIDPWQVVRSLLPW